ncbi:MAG: hypothetical protein IPM97_08170 [Bdellovibrionaceae bacterium]|nr:hypothetical protein [Pseudobdellovibrionaceae bacterium]
MGRVTIPSESWSLALAQIKEISTDEEMSVKKLCERIEPVLDSLPDNHLKIGCDSRTKRYQPKIGKNITEPPAVWSFKVTKGVAQIGIISFPSHKEAIWNGFEDNFNKILKAKSLVIDLRGNPGGDDTMGWRLAEFLLGTPPSRLVARKTTSKTPETYALFLNSVYQELSYYEKQNQKPPDFLLEEKNELDQELAAAKSGKYPPIEIKEFPKTTPILKTPPMTKIYLLLSTTAVVQVVSPPLMHYEFTQE